jgi:uncharacterized protein (TIGR03086 family)
MPDSEAPLPTFLIIGAQKSGTRWLRVNTGSHPDVYTAPLETQFFHSPERIQSSGLDWYRAQFSGWAGERIVGEATPGYMMWRHRPRRVAQRIAETVPDVRLIALLRNPVDRAHSAMVHFQGRGQLPRGSGLMDFVRERPPQYDPLCLVTGGWYAASLKPYHQLFGDQLLVLLHDEVTENPRRVYEQCLLHIGASLDFVPPALDKVLFSNQLRPTPDVDDESNSARQLTTEERQQLFAYFRDDVGALEKMLGRDLSAWDPGGNHSVDLGLNLWTERPRARARMEELDVSDCYDQASTWIEDLVSAVSPNQYRRPTPCTQWDVRDLLERLVWLPYQCAATLRRVAPPGNDDPDIVSRDPAPAYRAAADNLLTAMREPGRLEGMVASPFGEMPAETGARFAFVDQLTHGWDLAVATGQDPKIPTPLLEAADRIVRGELGGMPRRPELFDVEVQVSDAATPTERFVAFLGRDPGIEPAATVPSS